MGCIHGGCIDTRPLAAGVAALGAVVDAYRSLVVVVEVAVHRIFITFSFP